MGRHRIEIEFDSDQPEELYEMVRQIMTAIDESPMAVPHAIEVSMTPVVSLSFIESMKRGIQQAHEGKVTHRSFLDDTTP